MLAPPCPACQRGKARVCADIVNNVVAVVGVQSQQPARDLGFREERFKQPTKGLAATHGAIYYAEITFEACAKQCGDDCAAFVRRNVGNNCWLVPRKWYPVGGTPPLKAWTGGTTYVKLQTCPNKARDSCEAIWGVPCPYEDYNVKNTIRVTGPLGAYEYATLDDVPASASTQKARLLGQRCPLTQRNCAGSNCAPGVLGQNYFLKIPTGWELFDLLDQHVWTQVVPKGWATHCVNDPVHGASLWTVGSSAGFQLGDKTDVNGTLAVKGECGGVHEHRKYDALSHTYKGWFMEFSPTKGVRALSCGSRFLIRRDLNCKHPTYNITKAVGSTCKDATDVGSCSALVQNATAPDSNPRIPQPTRCDATIGTATLWNLCCATCVKTFGKPQPRAIVGHGTDRLRLVAVGKATATASTQTNWAMDNNTVILDSIEIHRSSPAPAHKSSFINDGHFGDNNAWSADDKATGGAKFREISIGYAFSMKTTSSQTLRIDRIAFGRDNKGAAQGRAFGVYTIQVSYNVVQLVSGTASAFEKAYNANARWETIGTLIYDSTTTKDPFKRHEYTIFPAVAITGIRIVVNNRNIVIDEFQVYGTAWKHAWTQHKQTQLLYSTKLQVSDSTGASAALIDGLVTDKVYSTSPGASLTIKMDKLYAIYQVRFRVPKATNDLHIRRCKIAYLAKEDKGPNCLPPCVRHIERMMYVTDRTVSPNAADAAYILDLVRTHNGKAPSEMNSANGYVVNLPVPLETSLLRIYDIQGQANMPTVKVQVGLSGAEIGVNPLAIPKDPQIDVNVEAAGFNGTVGCDSVQYSVTVRHKTSTGSARTGNIRVSDMLADPKIKLVPGTVQVQKRTTFTTSSWQSIKLNNGSLQAGTEQGILYGNHANDSFVMVDIQDLLVDEILRLSYSVQAMDPEPQDIISALAVVEKITRSSPCIVAADNPSYLAQLCVCGKGKKSCNKRNNCGVRSHSIARHLLQSDVGKLSFDSQVSYGTSTRPLRVTVDGKTEEVYMITMGVDIVLSAGKADNVVFKIEVPHDRTKYFELLSIDNLDNTGSRSSVSDDEAVLLTSSVEVKTESISVPCSSNLTQTGLRLELTAALYNHFYYSKAYMSKCTLSGCNELTLKATLDYDLVSSTLFHRRLSNEQLFNITRTVGITLPVATLVPAEAPYTGVHYTGGHPTWPLWTMVLDNHNLPAYGYEGTVTIGGDFDKMRGRLSVIVAGGKEEFFVTRNPLQANSSFGTVGMISPLDTIRKTANGANWDVSRLVTASSIELKLVVLKNSIFITGRIDGHVVTKMLQNTGVTLSSGITVSVYKEFEADDLVIGTVDITFVCNDCKARHSESHDIVVPRPGSPPDDIKLNGTIRSGACATSTCVVEGAKEGTKVASLSVVDPDWAAGDTYLYSIVEQDVKNAFRLSTTHASRQDEVFLEVAVANLAAYAVRRKYSVRIMVRDNLWHNRFITRKLELTVLAHPDKVQLSTYVVPEQAKAGHSLATITSHDPDRSVMNKVQYFVSGDDAQFFSVKGTNLTVGDKRGKLPTFLQQAFYDIIITARDENGLEFATKVELSAHDIDECQLKACSGNRVECVNAIGGYQCMCKKGFKPVDPKASNLKCVDIRECDSDNGGCGDNRTVICKELLGSYRCDDIDECKNNNGGCGDPKHILCVNQNASAVKCVDVCGCSASCSAGQLCTNYDKEAKACSGLAANGNIVGTSTTVSKINIDIAVEGNTALDETEFYALRSPPAQSSQPGSWVPVALSDRLASPADCQSQIVRSQIVPIPVCTVKSQFARNIAGNYYVVVKNHGRGVHGSPFQIKILADKKPNKLQATGDGLIGGASTPADAGYSVDLTAYDQYNNQIYEDILSVISTVTIEVSDGGKQLQLTAPTGSVPTATAPKPFFEPYRGSGVYKVWYNFYPKALKKDYKVTVKELDGTPIKSVTTFICVAENTLSAGMAIEATTIVPQGGTRTIAGMEDSFVMEMRNKRGLRLRSKENTKEFAVSVVGPSGEVQITPSQGSGLVEAKYKFYTAGLYKASLRYKNSLFRTIKISIVAGTVVPSLSTVMHLNGPFAVQRVSKRSGVAGQFMHLKVSPRDQYGNENTEEPLESRLKLRMIPRFDNADTITFGNCPECNRTCVGGTVARGSDGRYEGSYMVQRAGAYTLTVEIDGISTDRMPAKVDIKAATADKFSGTPKFGHYTAVAGKPASFPLIFADRFDNSRAFPGGAVFVSLTPPSGAAPIVPMTDRRSDGVLEVHFTCQESGSHRVTIKINDIEMESTLVLLVQPAPGISGSVIYVAADGSRVSLGSGVSEQYMKLTAGSTATLEVTAKDTFSNSAPGGSQVTAVLRSKVPGLFKEMIFGSWDPTLGVYTVKVSIPASAEAIPGDFLIRVMLDGASVLLKPVAMRKAARCSVQTSSAVVSAGQPATVNLSLTNVQPSAKAQIGIHFGNGSKSGGSAPVVSVPSSGAVQVEATMTQIGTYVMKVLLDGDAALCGVPRSVIVISAEPDINKCALVTNIPKQLQVGRPFTFQIKGEDKFGNSIVTDPFNDKWKPFDVSIVVGQTVYMKCLQKSLGETVDIKPNGDSCAMYTSEAGVAVISANNTYSLSAKLPTQSGLKDITNSPQTVVVAPIPVDPLWAIQIQQTQLQLHKAAGSSQRIVVRVTQRSTGIQVRAINVAAAWFVNVNISSTCCSYCTCQTRAKTGASVLQLGRSDLTVQSNGKLNVAGNYAIRLELVTSEVITIPREVVIEAGKRVARLYTLAKAWPKPQQPIQAGANTQFTLLANDVFGNAVHKGGDMISAVATYKTSRRLQAGSLSQYLAVGRVADNGDGSYTVSYRPTLSGVYQVAVDRVGEGSIPHHPWLVTVRAAGVDPSRTTLDKTQLSTTTTVALSVRDTYGNGITTNDPGIAFTYAYQFTYPRDNCGGVGETCQSRLVSNIEVADGRARTDLHNAVDSRSDYSAPNTWLGKPGSTQPLHITLKLAQPTTVDRLKVTTFPDAQLLKLAGKRPVSMSFYYSLDGKVWKVVHGITNGYPGPNGLTDLLPKGTTLDPTGPEAGGSHIEHLEQYVDSWSIIWQSVYMQYFRITIVAEEINPDSSYPVRELQLFDCRCLKPFQEGKGVIVWDTKTGAYQKTMTDRPITHDGIISLSVRYGLRPIQYVAGYDAEPYLLIRGHRGDEKSDCGFQYQRLVVEQACSGVDYCSPMCAREFDRWKQKCGYFGNDFLKLDALCYHAVTYDASTLQPVILVPSKSPGISDSVPAGEIAVAQLLLVDPDGKVEGASHQWLDSTSMTVKVVGPAGPLDSTLGITSTGAVKIAYTPVQIGRHTVSVFVANRLFASENVTVVEGQPPLLISAEFTADWATLLLRFDKGVSSGRGHLECATVLSLSTLRVLGSTPLCRWYNASTLAINLGSEATIQANDLVEILPGVVARFGTNSLYAQGSARVMLAANGDAPRFCVPSEIVLGACEDLVVAPGCQTGGGGRPLTFELVAHSSTKVLLQSSFSRQTGASITVKANAITFGTGPSAQEYIFYVRARNSLGVYSDVEHSIRVTRSKADRLPVYIKGDSTWTISSTDPLFFEAELGNSCAKFDSKLVKFSWTHSEFPPQIAGPTLNLKADVQYDRNDTKMYVAGDTLRPGLTYKFTVTGTDNAGKISGNATVIVSVRNNDLIAKIDGCDRDVHVNDSVWFDASKSFDPDSPKYELVSEFGINHQNPVCQGGGSSCDHLKATFEWTCKAHVIDQPDKVEPCLHYAHTEETLSVKPRWKLDGGLLEAGKVYHMSVKVTVLSLHAGIKTAFASVTVTPTVESIPAVGIRLEKRFGKRSADGIFVWNSNEQIKFVGSMPGIQRGKFRWSFLQGGINIASTEFSEAKIALTIPVGALAPGQLCVLQLEGKPPNSNSTAGTASVTFWSQTVPRAGSVTITSSDAYGKSLLTDYVFEWTHWVGAQFYQLLIRECQYGTCSDTPLTMRTKVPQISTKFSAASMDPATGVVTVVAKVIDAYGSSSSTVHPIAIQPNGAVESEWLQCADIKKLVKDLANDLWLTRLGGYSNLVKQEQKNAKCEDPSADAVQQKVTWKSAVTTNSSGCRAQVQVRKRAQGYAWGRWSGDPTWAEAANCTEIQTRVRWKASAAVLPTRCLPENQTRTRVANQDWSGWVRTSDGKLSKYTEPKCSEIESRLAWRSKTIYASHQNTACSLARQYRISVDGGAPKPWAGMYDTVGKEFTFDKCTQIEAHTAYTSSQATLPQQCVPKKLEVTRENNGPLEGQQIWQAAIQSCRLQRTRVRYRDGYGTMPCQPEKQTSYQTYGQSATPSAWSPWTGTAVYETCIGDVKFPQGPTSGTGNVYMNGTFNAKTIKFPAKTENRTRFRLPVSVLSTTGRCESETQVRSTGLDGEWSIWSGSFKYISCFEADVKKTFRETRSQACVSQAGVRVRECDSLTPGTCDGWDPAPKAGKGEYTSDFKSFTCTMYQQQKTYYASGYNVAEDFSALNTYACKALVQERDRNATTSSWDSWQPKGYNFGTCAFDVSRYRWEKPIAGADGCKSEEQARKLKSDGNSYTKWSGSYRYEHCLETRSRYVYGEYGKGTKNGCLQKVAKGWRLDPIPNGMETDGSKWNGDPWLTPAEAKARNFKYPNIDCSRGAQPQERIAYKRASPLAAEGCISEKQNRFRADVWGSWTPVGKSSAAFQSESCLDEELRTRWLKVPGEGCRSEKQSRYQLGHDAWSQWTGEFTQENCTDWRIRYKQAAAPEGKCVPQNQTMTGDQSGAAKWAWPPGESSFTFEKCEEIQMSTFWLAPVSWDGPCKRAIRERRRPAPDNTTNPNPPWGAYGEPSDYVYRHCVYYQSRVMFGDKEGNGMAGDGQPGDGDWEGACHAETQVRECKDCWSKTGDFTRDWSLWKGHPRVFSSLAKWPMCDRKLKNNKGFQIYRDPQTKSQYRDIGIRTQFQSVKAPCVNETQVRLKLPPYPNPEGKPGTVWSPWSGDFVYKFCPFDGAIETRRAWLSVTVYSPTECIYEEQTRYEMDKNLSIWSEWIGDFQFTKCTEVQTEIFYVQPVALNTACTPVKQVRTKVVGPGTNKGSWSKWSGNYTSTSCIEVRERTLWHKALALGGEVCLPQVQNQRRAPTANWSATWSGTNNYTEPSCTEITNRVRWKETATASECVNEPQNRSRTDGGPWSRWSGTYMFDICDQTEQRTRYEEPVAPDGHRCNSEIQTRTRSNGGNWSDWTGSPTIFNETVCSPGAPTVETRVYWLEPVTTDRCKSEVQQRTVSRQDPDPDWSGTYNYSSCSVVERRVHYKDIIATTCSWEEQSRTAIGTTGVWSKWSGTFQNANCTQVSTMWQDINNDNRSCVSEVQTRYFDDIFYVDRDPPLKPTDYNGTFKYANCTETERFTKWESPSVKCNSEKWLAGLVLRNPTGDCGKCKSQQVQRTRLAGAKHWSGFTSDTSGTTGTYVFDKCEETDVRRRYEYPQRGAGEKSAEDNCTLSSEAQTRARTNNGKWSPWSGTAAFKYSKCLPQHRQFEGPRARWYQTNTDGCDNNKDDCCDSKNNGDCGNGLGKDGSCVREEQVRFQKDDGKIGEWSGSYIYDKCVDYQTSQKYKTQVSINSPCRSAVARRQRTNRAVWEKWVSAFNYTECTEIQKRVAWKESRTAALCVSEKQERQRKLPGGTFKPWTDNFKFKADKCVQLDTRRRWYRPTASELPCTGEDQNRSRTNNGDWDCWDGTFLFPNCKQTQTRTRFKNPSATKCEKELQTRERNNGGTWSLWTGNPVFKYPDCVQPGKQVDERVRYRKDKADKTCFAEFQSRKRDNGGRWSSWACVDRKKNAVTCDAVTTESCVQIKRSFKYENINNMCQQVAATTWKAASPDLSTAWIKVANPKGQC